MLFTWFYNTKQSPEILNLQEEMLFEFKKYWALINGFFGFTIDLTDIGLLDKNLSDTDSNLFKTNIDSFAKYFVCFQEV